MSCRGVTLNLLSALGKIDRNLEVAPKDQGVIKLTCSRKLDLTTDPTSYRYVPTVSGSRLIRWTDKGLSEFLAGGKSVTRKVSVIGHVGGYELELEPPTPSTRIITLFLEASTVSSGTSIIRIDPRLTAAPTPIVLVAR